MKTIKKLLLKATIFVTSLFVVSYVSAQTSGTLTFTFTESSQATTYVGNAKHVLAVWIQTGAGAFVKTKLRYAGGGTWDHLPTWASQASCAGGTCLSASCNTLDGTTGATRSAWSTYTVTWDGKMGATATGTLQPDGVYQIAIESTWDHGTAGTALTTYTFTKGPTIDNQTPTSTTNITSITLNWQPSSVTGINEAASVDPEITVYPNPTNGVFNIDYANATNIRVMNTLGVLVYETKIEELTPGTKNIDLSNFANGIYMIYVSNENGASIHKVIFNK